MIIAASAWARCGKDTVADYLVEKHGYVKLSFATPMREALYRLNPTIQVGGYHMSLAQAVDLMGWEALKAESTDIRALMQRLGTEVGREMFGQDFWVNLAMKEATKYEKVVFADCRFVNEAEAVRSAGGAVWRIERKGFGPANEHVSERALDDYGFFAAVIENHGTIEQLHANVESVLDSKSAPPLLF